MLGINAVGSTGASEQFGFNGVGIGVTLTNTTIAQIDDGATIVVGSVHVIEPDDTPQGVDRGASLLVEATDTSCAITVAGSLATSEKIGIGGSLALNLTSR